MCTPHSVRLNQLKDIVSSEIKQLINTVLNVDNEKYLTERLQGISDTTKVIEVKTKELSGICQIILEKNDVLTELYMDKVKGLVKEDDYVIISDNINKIINEQQAKYTRLKDEIEALKIINVEKPDPLTLAKKYADFEELTTEIVVGFIDYIEVGDKDMYGNQELHIYWNI